MIPYSADLFEKRDTTLIARVDQQQDKQSDTLIWGKMFELRPTVSSGVITSWTCFSTGNGNWIDQEYIKSCM